MRSGLGLTGEACAGGMLVVPRKGVTGKACATGMLVEALGEACGNGMLKHA